ncbi:hypothetical protein Salat_1138600 [Sesamum alatum]|uniref:Uncharacterized protein n=1 Tax=Sesamum alatum TaxID=300844 RepID=A0AAE2CN84_9LAMI|nr:hypothetical protein Salat_1138600 [Sesamum alatum]
MFYQKLSLNGDKRFYKKVNTGFQLLTTDSQCLELGRKYRVVRDVPVYVELLGESDTGHGNGGVHDDGVDDMGRLEERVDVDEDADLVDSDYGISTEVGDDDNIFKDNVDDSIIDNVPIDDNKDISDGISPRTLSSHYAKGKEVYQTFKPPEFEDKKASRKK